MANNASDYLEKEILNHIFGNNANAGNSSTSYSAPATNSIYVSLHTTAGPLDDNSATAERLHWAHMLDQMLQTI